MRVEIWFSWFISFGLEVDPISSDLAVPEFRPSAAFENAAAPLNRPPRWWIGVVGEDEDFDEADVSSKFETCFEALDGVAISPLLRRNVVPDMADLAKHVRSVDVVADSDDTDNVSLVVDDPAVGAGDDSVGQVYAFLFVIERLDVGGKFVATLFVPFADSWIVSGVVGQHAQERLAVGLVKANDGHGRVHFGRNFKIALQ